MKLHDGRTVLVTGLVGLLALAHADDAQVFAQHTVFPKDKLGDVATR